LLLQVKEASLHSLSLKQCATFICWFLSFIIWSEGTFSLSQAVFSSLGSSVLFVY
jgi:hypothetical protein